MKKSTKIILISANVFFWIIILFIGFAFEWNFPPFETADGTFYPSMLWGNLFNAVVLYANALILYPYRKRLWIPYWMVIAFLLIGTSVTEAFVDYQLVFHLDIYERLDTVYKDSPALFITDNFLTNIAVHFLWYILSFAIVFLFESNRNQRIQKTLEEEKLKAELKFLRAQINPHFLFNGINSVYFLIDEKPEIAKSTLLKFSDLLRYQLYECQDDSISLAKELSHVNSYIEMERIRRGDDLNISLALPGSIGDYEISPLLFTPFLENAFKYVSNDDDGSKNKVDITFEIIDDQLNFNIENTVDDNSKLPQGGIGIANVRKRLELLYPQKHNLEISEFENRFKVEINLTLQS